MILLKYKLRYGLSALVALIIAMTTFQDLLASVLLDRGFYLSESLLFKIVWLLFLPSVLGIWYFFKSPKISMDFGWKYLFVVALLSGIHLFLAGIMITLVAQWGLALPFTFSGIEKYLIVHQGPIVLLLYGLVMGLKIYFQKQGKENTLSKEKGGYTTVLSVRQGRKWIPIPVAEILFIQSESPYSCIVTPEGKHLTSKSLKQLEKEMDPARMVRVHRSTIVNVERIKELRSRSNGDYDLLLQNGKMLRWSRNYSDRLKELLHLAR